MKNTNNTNKTQYIQNIIKNCKTITAAEEKELFRIMRTTKNPVEYLQARNKIFESNLKLLGIIIGNQGHESLEYSDIFSEATIALGKAIDTYDESKGASLFTHASWICRGALTKLFKECELVAIPANKLAERNRLKKLANQGKLDGKQEETLKSLSSTYISTSTPIGDKDSHSILEDTLASDFDLEDHISKKESSKTLQRFIKKLPNCLNSLQLEIVERYFGLNKKAPETCKEIANSINKSRQRVNQILAQSMQILKNTMDSKEFKGLAEAFNQDCFE